MAKLQTQASYQARLDRVVDHIYAHLDDDIRPEGLAEIACLSPRGHGVGQVALPFMGDLADAPYSIRGRCLPIGRK